MKKMCSARPIVFNLCMTCMLTGLFSVSVRAQVAVLDNITIVTGSNALTNGEKSAVTMLAEEVEKRSGLKPKSATAIPATGNVIILKKSIDKLKIPFSFNDLSGLVQKPESFRIAVAGDQNRTVILVEGYDSRGEFFGTGKLLRLFGYGKNSVSVPVNLSLSATPDKPIRGHQLGYRNTANSYDALTPAKIKQNLRELAIFCTNNIQSHPIFL